MKNVIVQIITKFRPAQRHLGITFEYHLRRNLHINNSIKYLCIAV